MSRFQDNLRKLPSVEHIHCLDLLDEQGETLGSIANRPGSAGSVAIYYAVSRPTDRIDVDAARRALALYAEHVEAARAQPGTHPNIDRLFDLIARHGSLRIRIIAAPA